MRSYRDRKLKSVRWVRKVSRLREVEFAGKKIGNLHGRGNLQRRRKRLKNGLRTDLHEAGCEALYRADLTQAGIS